MRRLALAILILALLAFPARALETETPVIDISPIYEVPESARTFLPQQEADLPSGLGELLWRLLTRLPASLGEALRACSAMLTAVLLCALFRARGGGESRFSTLAGSLGLTALFLGCGKSMAGLCRETVRALSDYGKLLLPVMASALAASGGTSASGGLYLGTALFDSVLTSAMETLLFPMVYAFLALAFANAALGGELLQKLRDLVAWAAGWGLKLLLYLFTGYMTLTGVLGGTADAAAVKAAKATLSTAIPVVGSMVAGASDVVVAGASALRSSAGVYGLLAVLAICAGPFCRIGMEYLLLKLTWALTAMAGDKVLTAMVGDFAKAMGLLLAMVAASGLMLLISIACFMKGVSPA